MIVHVTCIMFEYFICLHLITQDPEEIFDHHRNLTYKQRIERDERRFKLADENGDGKLDREEFADFLHPGVCVCVGGWVEYTYM